MKDSCSTNSHNFTCCGEGKVGALGLYVSTGKGIPELPGSTTYQKYTICPCLPTDQNYFALLQQFQVI
jgi:hypothetical protein